MEVGANCLPEARYKNKYFREAWRFLRFLMNILMVWIDLRRPVFMACTLRLAEIGVVTRVSQSVSSTFPWKLHFYFLLALKNVQNVQ